MYPNVIAIMSDASVPIQASKIKLGGHAILKMRPCKIIQRSVSKTGKHGHAKIHFVGVDVFTRRKYEDICGTTHMMMAPVLTKTEYELIDIDVHSDPVMLCLLDADGNTKENVPLPTTTLCGELQVAFENGDDEIVVWVSVLVWGEEEAVISFRTKRE